MSNPHSVNVRAWFGRMDSEFRLCRFRGTNWEPQPRDTVLSNGFLCVSLYGQEPYVWAGTVEGSEYDTDLLRLLGTK